MKLEMRDILNKHKDSPALCIAHGPSYNAHKDRIKEYKDKGFIIYDCNEWEYFQTKCAPDYWVVANNEWNIRDRHGTINAWGVPYLYADTVDLFPRELLATTLTADYLPYDQRHFNEQPCVVTPQELKETPNRLACCKHIIPGRLTIQEELKKHTNFTALYSSGQTVAIHILTFAVLMGCNPIYFIGIDLDYRGGYAKTTTPILVPNVDHGIFVSHTVNDLTIIRDSAKNIGVEIFNLNKESQFDTFKIGSIT